MQEKFVFLLFGILFSAAAYAGTVDIPPELLFAGKPIDPKCVSAAMEIREGVDLGKGCAEFSGDGFPAAIAGQLTQKQSGAYGYDLDFEDGKSGGFFYRYVGKTDEGLILDISYSSGGSGHFSRLGVYRREGDILREARNIAGGDRCAGGIRDAKMQEGHLFYSYNMTSLELYQKYTPGAKHRGDLGNGFVNCGAVIYMKDDKIENVELVQDAIIPPCFKDEYAKQAAAKKMMPDNEARAFIREFSEACAPQEVK